MLAHRITYPEPGLVAHLHTASDPGALCSGALADQPRIRDRMIEHMNERTCWYGKRWQGRTPEDVERAVNYGDPEALEAFRDALNDFAAVAMGQRPAWVTVPYGCGAPLVPLYLAGVPDHFIDRAPAPGATTPLRIYVAIESEQGVSGEQITRRGAAVARFAELLGDLRPVELWLVASKGHAGRSNESTYYRAPVGVTPMAAAAIAGCLANPAFARGVLIGHHTLTYTPDAWHVPFPWTLPPTSPVAIARARSVLALEPQDVYLPGAASTNDPLTLDPKAWLEKAYKEQLDRMQHA